MSDVSGYGAISQAISALAVATLQAIVAYNVSNKQFSIAKRQMEIAEFTQGVWKTNHLPVELRLLAEMAAIPIYTPKYDLVTTRATNDVAIAFGRTKADTRRNMSPYCVGSFQALERQFSIGQALAEADSIATARRREDGRKDIKDQMRVDNIIRAQALGRGLLDTSGSAMRGAAEAAERGGATIASALNSGAAMLGYMGRRDTNPGGATKAPGGASDWDQAGKENMKIAEAFTANNPATVDAAMGMSINGSNLKGNLDGTKANVVDASGGGDWAAP